MNQLKEILSKIEDKEAESRISPEEADPRTRTGVEALVRNAKADLGKLYENYKNAVMGSVVIIGVKGETSKEFADEAEKLGSISVDFNLIRDRLVNNLKSRAVGEVYTSHAHMMLIDELSRIRLEYDMVRLPTPQVNGYSDGIYNSPLNVAVAKLLVNNYGTSLESAVSRREIGKKALAVRFKGKKLPVILYNLDSDVSTDYLSVPNTVIESNGKVSSASVKKQLTAIANSLKSSDKKENEGSEAQTQENT